MASPKTKTTQPAGRGRIVAEHGNVEMMDISPEFAGQLLVRRHKNQRPLKEHYVFELSQAMVEGRWRWTADVIRLDKDLRVIDGQHRLSAVVKSGITLKDALVATVETKDAILSIDQNRPRNLNDLRATRGQRQLSRLVTGAIIAESCDWYGWRGMPRELQIRTIDECKFTAALEGLTTGSGNRRATLTVGALSGALRCMRSNVVEATKFFDAVFAMTPIIDGKEVQMVRVLYTFLAESKASTSSTAPRAIEHAHKSVTAYNHWKLGEVVTRLAWKGAMPPRVVG
jgi:hypothetical protein